MNVSISYSRFVDGQIFFFFFDPKDWIRSNSPVIFGIEENEEIGS